MPRSKETVTVEIAGTRFRLTTDADREHLEHLARLVGERIDSLGSGARRSGTPAQLLAAAALALAEELEESERRRLALRDRAAEVMRQAIGRIDARLAADVRDR